MARVFGITDNDAPVVVFSSPEFPEMSEHCARAHALLAGSAGHAVQMLARLGYAAAPAPAPREPLESKLLPA